MFAFFAQLFTNLPLIMSGENLIIASCYVAIGSGIAYGIWRNRKAGINPVVLTLSAILFSCAFGHAMHGLSILGLHHAIVWQIVADLITVVVAIRFLSFYESFDVLAQISQIVASKTELESQNKTLQEAMEALKKTQTQLVQAEKMSSLGQLVAGIAHEVNNPINFIHGNLLHVREHAQNLIDLVQLYQKHYPSPVSELQTKTEDIDLEFVKEDLPKILDSMKRGTERIRQIVQSLRNFSRLDESDFKVVDIHEGIESALLILQHRLRDKSERPGIQVIREYGNLPKVECYVGQLNQVFMNILTNAIDALDEASIGRTPKEIKKKPNQITIHTAVKDMQWVQITIADNGPGMPESTKQQIFNPFFTTKAIGKGTGLGMSISYQIITEKHGGKLECFSIPGEKTEFLIQIPVQQRIRPS